MTAERLALFNPQESASLMAKRSISSERIEQVLGLMPVFEMAAAMQAANPNLPQGAAEGIIMGDQYRVRLLPRYYERFLPLPISDLMAKGVIGKGYSASELGTAFLAHLLLPDSDLMPGSVMGFDNQPHIVAAARVNIEAMERAGKIPTGKYRVTLGDHTSQAQRTDIAFLSLVSQYEGGEEGAVTWLMNHAETGINGDVVHGLNPITPEELASGVLRVKSKRSPDLNTGIAWQLKGEGRKTAFGDVYDAQIMLDPGVFRHDRVKHVRAQGDQYEGRVTVYERDGKLYFNGWAVEETPDATEDQIREVVAIRETFDDIYMNLGAATGGARVWDGNSAAAIPAKTLEQDGLHTVATITTLKDSDVSGTLPWAIIRRHQQEVGMLEAKGLLSQVGEGRAFKTLPELFAAVDKWLRNPQGYAKSFRYQNPLLITTITTKDRGVFEALAS